MKLSNLLYLLIVPLMMTPSLNANKDTNAKMNIESVYVQEDLVPDRRCERNLRESEAANRYMEKELFVLEDKLTRANQRMRRMKQKIQDQEYELNRYQKRGPRRPNAHGYNTGKGKAKVSPRSPSKPSKSPARTPSRSRKNY